jgi:hypothetical protein
MYKENVEHLRPKQAVDLQLECEEPRAEKGA